MNNTHLFTTKKYLLALLVPLMMNQLAWGQEQAVENQPTALGELLVTAKKQVRKAATDKINNEAIAQEMIRNNKDLVRYSVDVGIADSDSRASKGFAMRGVEGNRVGVSIDGVSLPDFQENSLYSRYGNFNSSRPAIDVELVRGIEVVKGSDSFNYGSGNLGGGVNYRTLSANDIVQDDGVGGFVKAGYASKNEEFVKTVGSGYIDDHIEGTLVYSHKNGRQTKSLGSGERVYGAASAVPDPMNYKNQSYLAKFVYTPNENYRLGASINGQDDKVDNDQYSWVLSGWRTTSDRIKRQNANAFVEYSPSSNALSKIRLDADSIKTDVGAYTEVGSINYDWSNGGALLGRDKPYEFKDRKMINQMSRIGATIDTKPATISTTKHRFRAKLQASKADFENSNFDYYILSGKRQGDTWYSIQRPTKTQQLTALIADNIILNDKVSAMAGLRYDHTVVEPLAFNHPCVICEQSTPPKGQFQGFSGNFGVQYAPNPNWTMGYHLGSGYRVPTASEMYFSFVKGTAGNGRKTLILRLKKVWLTR